MQRQHAEHRVAARESARSRGAIGRHRPASIADPRARLRRDQLEREVAGAAGIGAVPAGQVDLGRVDRLEVEGALGQGRWPAPPNTSNACRCTRPATSTAVSGSASTRSGSPSSIARASHGSMRGPAPASSSDGSASSTATAPSRLIAAINARANAGPTSASARRSAGRSAGREAIRPRTTASTRRSASASVNARPFHRKKVPSGVVGGLLGQHRRDRGSGCRRCMFSQPAQARQLLAKVVEGLAVGLDRQRRRSAPTARSRSCRPRRRRSLEADLADVVSSTSSSSSSSARRRLDAPWAASPWAATIRAGCAPSPSRQRIHSATVGHVMVSAVEPTTRPKWPALTATSNSTSAAGAASTMPRTDAGARPISSRSPTKYRIGQLMSARVTVRPAMTKPPEVMRLATMNSSTNLRRAGPGQATKPSPPRNKRRASRFSSAWRSWSLRTNSTSWPASLRADSSLKPVDVRNPGRPSIRSSGRASARRASTPCEAARPADRPGQVAVDVDRAAHRDDRGQAGAAPERGGLVGEHAALRVAGQVHGPAGDGADAIDRLDTASTWSSRVRSMPPASRSGAPKSVIQTSTPARARNATALMSGAMS